MAILTTPKSQLRLGSFFAKPTVPSGRSPSKDRSGRSSRRSSVVSIDNADLGGSDRSTPLPFDQPLGCEYGRKFPPFFIHSYTTVAPFNRFKQDEGVQIFIESQIDNVLDVGNEPDRSKDDKEFTPFYALLRPRSRRRNQNKSSVLSVQDLISEMHGTASHPVDLTKANGPRSSGPLDLLKTVPVKYLRYAEDVRPPYIGTFSKVPTKYPFSKLCRQPFTRALPTTNYDYDSEAEWEEPEEGEDLDSEGEEEAGDDEEGDDMEEFLDDDEVEGNRLKRQNLMGDVQPVCTGLHWGNSYTSRGTQMVAYGETSLDLKSFTMEILLGMHSPLQMRHALINSADSSWPIDPHSTRYWPNDNVSTSSTPATMAPPSRVPLNTIHRTNTILPLILSSTATTLKAQMNLEPALPKIPTTKGAKPTIPSKPIPSDLLPEFREAVNGSDLAKAGLVAVLQKK